jgi:hypothetical protein
VGALGKGVGAPGAFGCVCVFGGGVMHHAAHRCVICVG